MNESAKVRAALDGAAVHEGWELNYRTAQNERSHDEMFARIAKLVPPGRCLDVGCGIGQHALRLKRLGFDVIAADFSSSRVEAARRHLAGSGIEVVQEDVTHLSFPNGSFDSVLCWGVLMHVPEVEQAIKELCRVTKHNGQIIVYENNARSVFSWALDAAVAIKRLLGRSGVIRRERGRFGPADWVKAQDGTEYIIRRIHVRSFVDEFPRGMAWLEARLPGDFNEAYRFFSPGSVLGRISHAVNRLWRRTTIASLALGNIFIFRKL